MGLLQRRLYRRFVKTYMDEATRLRKLGYAQPGDYFTEAVADMHQKAFRCALHEIGERRFKSAVEVQALEQVCIATLSESLKLRPDQVPEGGWPTWQNTRAARARRELDEEVSRARARLEAWMADDSGTEDHRDRRGP